MFFPKVRVEHSSKIQNSQTKVDDFELDDDFWRPCFFDILFNSLPIIDCRKQIDYYRCDRIRCIYIIFYTLF